MTWDKGIEAVRRLLLAGEPWSSEQLVGVFLAEQPLVNWCETHRQSGRSLGCHAQPDLEAGREFCHIVSVRLVVTP